MTNNEPNTMLHTILLDDRDADLDFLCNDEAAVDEIRDRLNQHYDDVTYDDVVAVIAAANNLSTAIALGYDDPYNEEDYE